MDDRQIQLLLNAASRAGLGPDQMQSLQVRNPFTMQGMTAERLQVAVGEIDPAQARAWRDEAGVTMSLQAAAAQRGLVEMTPQLQAEITRLNPQSPDEARQAEIEQLVSQQPFGTPQRYEQTADGEWITVPGTPGNLTAAMRLQVLDPALANRLKAAATPAAPSQITEGDAAVFARHGYIVTQEA